MGQFKIKLVERAGNKIVDVLHKSNAWSMMDCERDDCLICSTETSRKGTCRRRNVLYETFCITCKNEKEKKELNGEKTHSEIVILEEENQSKNLEKNDINGKSGKNNENKNQEAHNLTIEEKRGIQKLRNRIKEGEIVVLKTDKSGKLVVANKDEYLKMAKSKIYNFDVNKM